MRLGSRSRGNLGTAWVFVLVVCVFVFATSLKVSPSAVNPNNGKSPSHMKLWIDSAAQDSKVKLATPSGFFFIPFAIPVIIKRGGKPAQLIPAPRVAIKNAFAESSNWFRPPPLS